MSKIINWLRGNTIFIVTLNSLDFENRYELTFMKDLNPHMQWVFPTSDEALKMMQGITTRIAEHVKSEDEDSELKIEQNREISGQSQDIVLFLQLSWESSDTDHDPNPLFHLSLSTFQKHGPDWV